MTKDKRMGEKVVIHRNPTVVTQSFWYTSCQYLNCGSKTVNIKCKKKQNKTNLSTSYNGKTTHQKRQT